ncbi:hypothetical protein [Erwinia sp. SLM-02]|uniref:hypothetical protein n=1 Tax=Erwinia sp. SLM-02 TaxID=3020057 RepID=UPI003080A06F
MTFPLPAHTLIPHRGGMCCIDNVLSVQGQQVLASVKLHDRHLLLSEDGTLDRCGFIELAAQAACALKGIEAVAGSGSATALLASVNNFQVSGDARIGETLLISVAITTELAGLSLLEFSVACGPRLLASGQLKVFYQADN